LFIVDRGHTGKYGAGVATASPKRIPEKAEEYL